MSFNTAQYQKVQSRKLGLVMASVFTLTCVGGSAITLATMDILGWIG